LKIEPRTRKKRRPRARVPAFLMRALEERWGRLTDELRRNRTRLTEPGVHDLRVATRRLIAALDLAGAALPGGIDPDLRRTLRRCLKSFADLRDLHIQMLNLKRLVRRYRIVGPMLSAARIRQQQLTKEAARAVARFDYPRVGKDITTVVMGLGAIARNRAGVDAARAALMGFAAKRYLRVVQCRSKVVAANPKSIHRLRVSFKQFRYTLEVLKPFLPELSSAQLKAMGELQDRMGEIQDLQVLINSVHDYALTRGATRPASFLPLHQHLALERRALVDTFIAGPNSVGDLWPRARRIQLRKKVAA